MTALIVAVPFPYSRAGEKGDVDKKILKQVQMIENAPEEVRKEVLKRVLQILEYDEIKIEDILDDAKDEASSGQVVTS